MRIWNLTDLPMKVEFPIFPELETAASTKTGEGTHTLISRGSGAAISRR